MVIYKIFVFGADRKSNMAARGHNVFLTRRFLKFRPIGTHYGPWQPCWISDQRQKHKSCIWPSNEHFCQFWFKSDLNLLLWNRWTEISQTCQKCSLDGPLPDLCFWCWFEIQHGCQGP
jgi:hypothetical protein